MNKLLVACFALLVCCAPAFGQVGKKELLVSWEQAAELMIGVADAMPADQYDSRPTKEVRTFAEQVKHVAGVYANLLSWVRGVESPQKGNDAFMHLKTKDEIMAALRKTVQENTAGLKSMPNQQLAGLIKTQFFGEVSRGFVVLMAVGHTNRHYGQMVVYLRLNGIVPPISRDQ